nr:hypothetical protein [uncultured Albidiferax sp.]
MLCKELSALVEVVRSGEALLLSIRACAPDLLEVSPKPSIDETARFGLLTLAGHAEGPVLPTFRRLKESLMQD